MNKNPRQVTREPLKGWHVLDIIGGKEKKHFSKSNPIPKPFTRQDGLKHVSKKANQGT